MRYAQALLLIVATVGACRFDETAVPAGREDIVVHAVLDPGQVRPQILLERVLTGRIPVDVDVPFDSLDPIATRGGTPESGAVITIHRSTGDSAVAVERRLGSPGRGTGVYTFINASEDPEFAPEAQAVEILPGGTYHLRIVTAEGRILSATTTVPDVGSASRFFTSDPFNRDRDSTFVFWQAVPLAARYEIAVSTPYGRYTQFVDSLEFLVSGRLKNTASNSLSEVFVPGFTQRLTASAVDANYFDYYRSGNDAVSGRGLLNHVNGGLGLFGSAVVMRNRQFLVSADANEPLEGHYERLSGAGPNTFQLYVLGTSGERTDLSGNYNQGGSTPPALLGEINGGAATLAFLRGQSARDTLLVIDGRFNGERYEGQLRGTSTAVTYRRVLVSSAF